jgi:hypothetical protein
VQYPWEALRDQVYRCTNARDRRSEAGGGGIGIVDSTVTGVLGGVNSVLSWMEMILRISWQLVNSEESMGWGVCNCKGWLGRGYDAP